MPVPTTEALTAALAGVQPVEAIRPLGALLLGLAWLVSKPLSRWSVGAEETVWKLALVGALLFFSFAGGIAAAHRGGDDEGEEEEGDEQPVHGGHPSGAARWWPSGWSSPHRCPSRSTG